MAVVLEDLLHSVLAEARQVITQFPHCLADQSAQLHDDILRDAGDRRARLHLAQADQLSEDPLLELQGRFFCKSDT